MSKNYEKRFTDLERSKSDDLTKFQRKIDAIDRDVTALKDVKSQVAKFDDDQYDLKKRIEALEARPVAARGQVESEMKEVSVKASQPQFKNQEMMKKSVANTSTWQSESVQVTKSSN